MKLVAKKLLFAVLVSSCLPMIVAEQPQYFPTGSGTKLSSVEYFDPPNDQKVRRRLSGAEMTSLPGTVYDVKKLKIEQFGTNGTLEAVAEAPQCLYAPLDSVASSPGHLDMYFGDGRFHMQGEGFFVFLQQTNFWLVISNQQHTVIEMRDWKLPTK